MEQLTKALIIANFHSSVERMEVQFNPGELTLDRSVKLAEVGIPGLDAPLLQFVRGENEKLTLDLFFDTTEEGTGAEATSVTTLTDRVYSLAKIDPESHAPPICELCWSASFPGADLLAANGNQRRQSFTFVVESIKQKITLWSPRGVPLRATLSLTLREYKTLEQQLDQLNLSSPDRTHVHVTEQGDTLAAVAARFYRRPAKWRAIADANGIEDPRRLDPGRFLTIPPIR
jgi:nucleoid-associated protein YgaU